MKTKKNRPRDLDSILSEMLDLLMYKQVLTEETAEETTKLAIELDSDNAVFNIAVPFAGTKFFVYTMLNKLFSPQSETVEGEKRPLARSHSLSQEKILELKNEADSRMYIEKHRRKTVRKY